MKARGKEEEKEEEEEEEEEEEKEDEEGDKEIVMSEIVYQCYGLPLLVSDRDFVFNRSWTFTQCEESYCGL